MTGRAQCSGVAGGNVAWTSAEMEWEALRSAGVDAFLTDGYRTFDAKGRSLALIPTDVALRVRALLLRQDVQALIVVTRSAADQRALEIATR